MVRMSSCFFLNICRNKFHCKTLKLMPCLLSHFIHAEKLPSCMKYYKLILLSFPYVSIKFFICIYLLLFCEFDSIRYYSAMFWIVFSKTSSPPPPLPPATIVDIFFIIIPHLFQPCASPSCICRIGSITSSWIRIGTKHYYSNSF